MKFPSLLWITPKWPLPCHDGARMATVNLLTNLTQLGVSIELLSLIGPDEKVNPDDALAELKVHRVNLIKRPPQKPGIFRHLFWLLSLARDSQLPLTLSQYASTQVQEKFQAILKNRKWDFGVYDGLHSAATSYQLGTYVRPTAFHSIIYRAHNFETELWEKSARSLPRFQLLKRTLLYHQRQRIGQFESALTRASSWVAAVSEPDAQHFKRIAPRTPASVIKIGMDFGTELNSSQLVLKTPQDLTLLFVGRLDWHPNSQGLKWFLEQVWPETARRRGDIQLWIAGSGDSSPLHPLFSQPRIQFWGRVEDLRPLYQACSATVIPLFYGSGTRVKAIESCRYGRVCISTQAGVEGLSLSAHETYLPAQTRQDWIEILTQLSSESCRSLGQNALNFVRTQHDGQRIAQEWIQQMERLSSGLLSP